MDFQDKHEKRYLMLPNVIIGGTQKAGTTSLFRYLADHPSVCPSSIKEVDFFLKYNDEIDMGAVKEYESFFPVARQVNRYALKPAHST